MKWNPGLKDIIPSLAISKLWEAKGRVIDMLDKNYKEKKWGEKFCIETNDKEKGMGEK